MNIEVLPALDEGMLRVLDFTLMDGDKRLYPLTSHFYGAYVKQPVLRVWCAERARYNVVTRELLDWLQEQIGGRTALEIGAGMGDLGHRLKIRMTDSYQQVEDAGTRAAMALMRQSATTPPVDVIKMDAQTAVQKFKPQVVIGAWITQRWLPGETEGNQLGPREEHILRNCETYIHIGNEAIHGTKRILKLRHQTFHFPWLVSRAKYPEQNVIHVWHRKNLP
jgi:hypothetical protein